MTIKIIRRIVNILVKITRKGMIRRRRNVTPRGTEREGERERER